ncbi:glycerophosphoryl diester phosphodiesterase membrane domain-containing protein [Novosphingobium sp.]|uniref:glycerophosphoryl diester phosphodiesterase membrane domain-containing protein n=1 Tax=Novosphingobium sp. TaxID=1874826 RepID=UPI0022C37A7E|nr:glycerophosphoryl diester phosphodiesterase membrane domain-containing protein [Novosphingobium sp.]MCZ8018193.1 glycerophosphoryl diester phosphodiesterase membrane domain-containing protein [Novosphingobium sp.]MCZ8033187.1 glycerophosphoryl diester phosphodiesterase membrane domain-containing protein [Novosphingobium sp.]MCZ8051642.1 glycerophosphoryl diester phosphodiesterase membrane domain-containing protein [Novosphingobium sp.]MCZ8060184.1 glycerophosphoryl diester phosphodiesterase 
MQKFSVGQALSTAFEIFKARFVPMAILTVIYYAILFAIMGTVGMAMIGSMAMGGGDPISSGAGALGGMILLYLAIYAINFWQQAAMCRLTSDRHEPSVGAAMTAGLGAILPLFGVLVLVLVAGFVVALVFGIAIGGAAMGTQSSAVGVIAGLAMLAGVIYLALRLSMTLPAIAIEDHRNPITALRRSWDMTRGHVLRLLALFVIVGVVMGLVGFTVLSATAGGMMASMAAGGGAPGAVPSMAAMGSLFVAMVLFGLTLGIFLMALIGAIHRQLSGESVAEVEATFA